MYISSITLDLKSQIDRIFNLCLDNGLVNANYCTNQHVWDFLYDNNYLKKSWNSVVVDSDPLKIVGHVGLVPIEVVLNLNKFNFAFITNGVISNAYRNKLLDINGKKVLLVSALIDDCVNKAFSSDVGAIMIHSSIPSYLWKGLKFKTLEITYCNLLTCSYSHYLKHIYTKFKFFNREKLVLKNCIIFSFIIFHSLIKILYLKFNTLLTLKRNCTVAVVYDLNEIERVTQEFLNENKEKLCVQRSSKYFDWLLSNNSNLVLYGFYFNEEIVGYCILDDHETYPLFKDAIDLIILKRYISHLPSFISKIKCNINFTIFLNNNLSKSIYKSISKITYLDSFNPLKFLSKKYFSYYSDLYFKENSSSTTNFQNNLKKLYYTKLYFAPKYIKKEKNV